jgi:predicted N-acetyltransferase YhbS
VTIRPANADEVPVVVNILRRSFATVAERFSLTAENCPRSPAFYTAQRFREDYDKGMQYYLLEQSDEVCGCVAMEPAKPGVVYLGRLAVVPEHRSKGLGTALVRHALAEAKAAGATRVEIGTISEDTPLGEWYSRFGFVLTTTKKFDGFPFIVAFMAKEL